MGLDLLKLYNTAQAAGGSSVFDRIIKVTQTDIDENPLKYDISSIGQPLIIIGVNKDSNICSVTKFEYPNDYTTDIYKDYNMTEEEMIKYVGDI